MHSFQSLLINMSIDLRCGNVRMTEHFLDDAKISSVPQEMRRKAVPQKMRVDVLFESGAARMFLYDLPDTGCC